MRLSPALIAALIGCLTTGFSLLVQEIAFNYFLITLPNVLFLAIQGIVAAIFARIFKLAIWWQWILLVFPLAVWMTLKLDLTPGLLFGGFLLFVLVYWSVFLTQVPYYPSEQGVINIVANLIAHDKRLKIVEIGSGLGGFSMHLSRIHPNSSYIGIEIAPLPYLVSFIRSKYQGSIVRFCLGNYEKIDLAEFDLVFAYLSPAAMPKLYEKCKLEMKPSSNLVSHEFIVPGVKPNKSLQSGPHSKITYVYTMS